MRTKGATARSGGRIGHASRIVGRLGLAGLASLGLAFGAAACGEDEPELDDAEVPVEATPGADADAAAVYIGVPEIMAIPADWTGRTVSGESVVAGVPTDRGFWISDPGEQARVLVILIDRPAEVPLDIQEGQRIRLQDAVVRGPDALGTLEGAELDADTRTIAGAQTVFLVVDEENVEVLSGGAAEP